MNEFHVFHGADKSTKIDMYKKGIKNTIQAIKFAQFEQAWRISQNELKINEKDRQICLWKNSI